MKQINHLRNLDNTVGYIGKEPLHLLWNNSRQQYLQSSEFWKIMTNKCKREPRALEITWIVYWWKRWSQDLLLVDRVSLEMLKFRPVGPQGTLHEIISPKVQIMSGLQWLKGCKGQVICMVTLRQNAFIVPCVNFPTGTNMHFLWPLSGWVTTHKFIW